ncbi:helix-turn-helix domain-containing protein [Nonomuraea phyllanthi]|uniref:Helix-turn-helix domain-containing protein n=1 Tax=Nonomuraea phyllanthi TaxID=2219224 RepID=A0A5C4W7E8_9ACTN|nr:helix-turn-helix transcriptional regulator [Nonomuraea phyllanthi]KAB8192381.1 helix-turn-helix domain-containing protein [Nonomuraea phyllanthi]QFY11265.1 helix-turn-helix domain-containing protein [Nonomuraea phyllanthi]
MDHNKLLGEFLRARREVTTPAQAGLVDGGPRRTPGLRREEVAMMAHVSTDYYIRLEQGRERHPSERVLGALARVFDLTPEATAHMHALAHPLLRPARAPARRLSSDLRKLIDSWPDTPALICDGLMNVMAANRLADALYSGFEERDNLLRMIFLDPVARDFYPEWGKSARSKVAHLRLAAGVLLDDHRLTELVGELSVKSADFRRLWARHDVSSKVGEVKRMNHQEVGELELTCEIFSVNSVEGLQLITLMAQPGSASEQALKLLGSLAAPARSSRVPS